MKERIQQSVKILAPIGTLGGFISDVLTPLGPVTKSSQSLIDDEVGDGDDSKQSESSPFKLSASNATSPLEN